MKWGTLTLLILTLLTLALLTLIILSFNYETLIFPSLNKANVCILLTTCVNDDPIRLAIYIDRINKYLKHDINFYIVESSGYTFPEFKDNPKVKIYSFIGKKSTNSSGMEIDSIIKIIDYYNLYHYDIILKITGKYYIPNIEKIVSLIDKKHEIILQNTTYLFSQNSEIFGCRPQYYKELNVDNTNFENAIPLLPYKKYRLPLIKLNDFTPRGDGNIMEFL